MVLGVMCMNIVHYLTGVPTLTSLQEIWDQQQSIAAIVKGEVFLFLPPTLSIHQSPQQSHLIRRSSVWTRPTGRIYMVLGVMIMKKMTGVPLLTTGQEIWDQHHSIAAIAREGFEL